MSEFKRWRFGSENENVWPPNEIISIYKLNWLEDKSWTLESGIEKMDENERDESRCNQKFKKSLTLETYTQFRSYNDKYNTK